MEEFLVMLLKQGLLGAIAAAAIYLYLGERKDNKSLRDQAKTDAAAYGESLRLLGVQHGEGYQEQASRYASVVEALRTAQDERAQELIEQFQLHLREADKTHHDQEDELTERLIKVHESYAEKNAKIIENAATLVDSINRRTKG